LAEIAVERRRVSSLLEEYPGGDDDRRKFLEPNRLSKDYYLIVALKEYKC